MNEGGSAVTHSQNDPQRAFVPDPEVRQTPAGRTPEQGLSSDQGDVGKWLGAWLQAAKSMAASSPKRCVHLATPGPMVIRVSDIASVRCPSCAAAQSPTKDEMHRCDKCQRAFPRVVKPIDIPLDTLVVEVKLCEDCRRGQLEQPPEAF